MYELVRRTLYTLANVVVDALSHLSMGSVAHVDDNKKELVRNVHRLDGLGVRFVNSNEGGVIVKIGSGSSLISTVKAKQYLDLVLVELKNSVSEKKPLRLSPKRKMVSINIKVGYVFRMLIS
ncbi:hypothetical protein MTR67_030883 [Solanum verrucosum]|uniref:Uncharacterized protein n=1 Tax=Solanum verrucosum TaxID=315347 RepID=A0AAF0U1F1_SOLVR|nr:hypothetical protein MTR67_030883 [Solanum verrucosum]